MVFKMNRKIKLIKQMSQTECGLCCVAMIMRYYKNYESIGSLQKQLEVGRDGANIKQLYDFLRQKGFEVKVFRGGDAGTISNVRLPCIAFFEHKHYVVIEKVTKDKVVICDPELTRRSLNYDEFDKRYSGYILEMVPGIDFVRHPKTKESPWYRILKMMLEHKMIITVSIFFAVISYAFYLYVPHFIQQMIDDVSVSFISTQGRYMILIIAMFLGYLVVYMLRALSLLMFNVVVGWFLEGWTFKKILRLPYKYYDIRSKGDILYRLVSTNGVKELLATQVVVGIVDVGAVIILSIYLFRKSIILGLICWIITLICLLFIFIMQPKMAKSMDDELIERTKVQEKETEVLSTMMFVKMSALENKMYDVWQQRYKELVDKFKKRMIIHDLYSGVMYTLQLFAPVVVLFVCLYLYVSNQMSFGEAIAYESISSTFFGLVISVTGSYTQFIVASTYLERINEIWTTEDEQKNENGIEKEIEGFIDVENLSFKYAKCSPYVLHKININIKKGTKVAFVGQSGSGKSTLAKILCGLYEPTEGNLKFDGINYQDYSREVLSSCLGIVPQDVMLFNKSIYNNIVMDNENVTSEQVEKVCKIACIYDEIKAMPMGFETIISEMGMNLSGGQKQRILLARVLLAEPKVVILDEATSSIDNISEKKISEYLYTQGCTRIIIAHRLSTVVDSDVIFVMDKGQIVDAGKHTELIERCSLYAELYKSAEI